jgi:hypothetical protein
MTNEQWLYLKQTALTVTVLLGLMAGALLTIAIAVTSK